MLAARIFPQCSCCKCPDPACPGTPRHRKTCIQSMLTPSCFSFQADRLNTKHFFPLKSNSQRSKAGTRPHLRPHTSQECNLCSLSTLLIRRMCHLEEDERTKYTEGKRGIVSNGMYARAILLTTIDSFHSIAPKNSLTFT